MASKGFIAFDLGAESGRAMLGILDQQKITLQEVHRFANLPQHLPSGYHWNLQDLWSHLLIGLKQGVDAAKAQQVKLVSLGVDTWGVDFGLIGQSGQLLGLPFAYRDGRTEKPFAQTAKTFGKHELYAATGTQPWAFNTLYQMIAQHEAEPALLKQAKHMLTMPDLLHYFFSGQCVNEATNASTTQMVDAKTGKWATKLLEKLNLPTHMLGKMVPAGTKIGTLRKQLAQELDIEPLDVIVPGSHDTASAIAAVPVDVSVTQNWLYLSSGTWSLMGAELDEPLVNDSACDAGFTNERGVSNKIRFLKNISGLWLVQEVRRALKTQGQSYDYPKLTELAAQSQPMRTLVDPAYAPFQSPGGDGGAGGMPQKIADFAKATSQPIPQTPGQLVRCCLESLALCYRQTLDQLQQLLGKHFDVLHIVGGGGNNQLLNQMTADALNIKVIVGPYEATAIGNALTQAMGAGHVKDLAQLRAIVRHSFDIKTYEPKNAQAYAQQMDRYLQLQSVV